GVALWLVGAAGCALVRAPAPPPITDGVQVGVASWYGPGFHGNRTANGEIYDQYELTAAHPSLPLGTRVMVTNLENGRAVQVRVNDRGPFVDGRAIDLPYAASSTPNGSCGSATPRSSWTSARRETCGNPARRAGAPRRLRFAAPRPPRPGERGRPRDPAASPRRAPRARVHDSRARARALARGNRERRQGRDRAELCPRRHRARRGRLHAPRPPAPGHEAPARARGALPAGGRGLLRPAQQAAGGRRERPGRAQRGRGAPRILDRARPGE